MAGGEMFRVVSYVEGVSLLLLLFVAMPAKYLGGYPLAVTVMGWIHGVLFIAYVAAASQCAQRLEWSERFSYIVLLAGVLPFGCFVLDRKLRRRS